MDLLTPLSVGVTMGLAFALVVVALAVAWRLFAFPDLTVEGTFLAGPSVFAALAPEYGLAVGVLGSLLAGAIGGTLTALVHSLLAVNKFLAGILSSAILYSLSLVVMGAPNRSLLLIATGGELQTQVQLVVTVTMVAVATVVATGSNGGLRIRVAGANPPLAKMLGIAVPLQLTCGLAATNALAALAGTLVSLQQGFADLGMSQGVLIVALAGMAVGEKLIPSRLLRRHVFVVLAAIGGSVIYQILTAFSLTIGVPSTLLKLATAVLVLVVVASGRWGGLQGEHGSAV